MARSRKSHPTSKSTVKITAAAPADASPAINMGGGIRSAPTQHTWRTWKQDNAGQSRERVIASRYLQEVLPFIGYLVEQLPEEAIGDGLVPTSESKDAGFKKAATQYFDRWARSPAIDIRRRFDFYSSQHMLARTMIGDGEVFVLKVADRRPDALARPLTDKSFRALQLQFLTRDQIGNGNGSGREYLANQSALVWDQGIQFNSLDIPQRYRVLKQTSRLFLSSYDERPAAQMMHIFADRMFNQRHGTPWIFRGEKSMLDGLDLRAVKKYAAKIRAYFLGAITTPTGDTPVGMRSAVKRGTKEGDTPGQKVDTGMRFLELAGGISLPVLKDGESISFFHGQEPISFAELLKEIWDEAVYCFGYPPEYLLNLVGLGSASVRMILRKVRKGHDRIRRPVRDQYCQSTWEFVIGDAIERGLLPLVEDWRMVTWKGGVDPSIDAGRDERAEQEKLRTFTGTVEQYCDQLGLDGETVRHSRLDEIADNILYGAKRGLPWFMCIDAMQVQAMTGLATSLGVDIQELVQQLSAGAGNES
jgi:hypothetical protein